MLFDVIRIRENVFVLQDRAECCAVLVVGEEKALLFDTGCGIDELRKTVETLTDKELLVIVSHGHFDHIGGAHEFETVYMAKEDRNLLQDYQEETVRSWLKEFNQGKDVEKTVADWSSLRDLDSDAFDLGNLHCHAISMPGHSRGSIGILIPSLRLLLGGDALLPIMCLFFANHGEIAEQLETLKRVSQLPFDSFLTSHSQKRYPKSIIERMIGCLERCSGKTFHAYRYSKPPFSSGWFYLDSYDEEPIGVIVENRP